MAGIFPFGGAKTIEYEAKAYEPDALERAILDFVAEEYERDRAGMSTIYENSRTIQNMANGTHVRYPTADSDYRNVYFPSLALAHDTITDLVRSRLVPDPASMDFVVVKLREDLGMEVYQKIIEEAAMFSEGQDPMTAQQAHELLEARLTVGFRYALANRSNFYDWLKRCLLDHRRYGLALGYVERVVDEFWGEGSEDEAVLSEFGDIEAEDFGAEQFMAEFLGRPELATAASVGGKVSGGGFKRDVVFTGLRFVRIPIFNLSVGNLHASSVSALPYVSVYEVASYRDLCENRSESAKDSPARYRNVDCVDPMSGDIYSSVRDAETGGAVASGNEGGFASTTSSTMEKPKRIGQFRGEVIAAQMNPRPKASDWKRFAEKFGLTVKDLEENPCWCVEWLHDSEGQVGRVLLCFSPWSEPLNVQTGSPLVEARRWERDGATIPMGDYEMGGGDFEVILNNTIDTSMTQADRTMDPAYGVNENLIDPMWMEENGGKLEWGRGTKIRLVSSPPDGRLVYPMSPSSEVLGTADPVMALSGELMRQLTGSAPQLRGGASDAKSATADANQTDYLERQLTASQTYIETNMVMPALRAAFAIFLDELKAQKTMSFVPNGERDAVLFGERSRALRNVRFVLQAEDFDIKDQYTLQLLTSSSIGNKQDQIVMLERLAGLVGKYRPYLIEEGKMPRMHVLLNQIAKLTNSPELYDNLTEQERQTAMMEQQMMQQGAQAPPTGGAGQERPGYDRNAPEVAAAGEPIEGDPLMSGQPGVLVPGGVM